MRYDIKEENMFGILTAELEKRRAFRTELFPDPETSLNMLDPKTRDIQGSISTSFSGLCGSHPMGMTCFLQLEGNLVSHGRNGY